MKLEVKPGAPFTKAEVELSGLPDLTVYADTGRLEEARAICRLCSLLASNQCTGAGEVAGVATGKFRRIKGVSETPLAPRSDSILHMLGRRPTVESDDNLLKRLTTAASCLESKS